MDGNLTRYAGCQLLSLVPHTICFRTGGLEGNRFVGDFQRTITAGGCEEEHQKAAGREVPEREEQVVLPAITGALPLVHHRQV